MFDENGQFSLKLGTSMNILVPGAFVHRNKPVYLAKNQYLINNLLVDNFTVTAFLSTLNDTDYHFSQTQKSI